MDIIIKVMYLLLWAEHSQCGKSFRVWTVASLQLKKETKRGISYEKKELLIYGECIGQLLSQLICFSFFKWWAAREIWNKRTFPLRFDNYFQYIFRSRALFGGYF